MDISFIISAVDNFSNQFDSLQSQMDNAAGAIRTMGTGMVAGGAMIAGGLGFAAKTAGDFEQQMARVKAISGATDGEFKNLRDTALTLGADTSKSAGEVAVAMEDMAAMGFSATETISSMPGVIAAAEASGSDLALTAGVVASAINGFGLEAGDASRIADVLAMSANVSAASVDDLGYAFKYAAPIAAGLGMSIEETAAAVGIMTDAGLDGSGAGTALRASLLALNNPVKAQRKIMEGLGISMKDAEGNSVGLTGMLEELKKGTEGMTDAERLATVAKLVGSEASAGMMALMNAGAGEVANMTAQLENSGGAAKTAADIMMNTLNGAVEEMGGAIETAAISIGTVLIPMVRSIAEYIGKLVNKFNGLSPSMQKMITYGALLAAGLLLVGGGLLLLISFIPGIIGGFTAIWGAFGALATAAGTTTAALLPIIGTALLVVAAIVGLGIAFYLAYQKFEGFRNGVNTVWAFVKNAFLTGVAAIKTALQAGLAFVMATWNKHKATVFAVISAVWATIQTVFSTIKAFIMQIWGQIATFWAQNGAQIKEATSNVWNAIKTAITTVVSVVTKVITVMMPFITGVLKVGWMIVKYLIISTWEAIKNVIQGAVNVILGIIKFFAALFTGDFKGMWAAVKQIFSGAIQLIWGLINLYFVGRILKAGKALFTGLKGVVMSGWSAIKSFFSSSLAAIRSNVTRIFSSVKSFFSNSMSSINNTAVRILTSILRFFGNTLRGIYNFIKTNITNARTFISNAMNAIKSKISAVWNAIKSKVTSVLSGIKNTVQSKFAQMKSTVSTAISNVKTLIIDGWNAAKSFLQNIDLAGIGRDIIQGLVNGIGSMMTAVTDKVKSVGKAISGALKGILNTNSPSKVTFEIGEWTGQGLANGIGAMEGMVAKSAARVAEAAFMEPKLGEPIDVGRGRAGSKGDARSGSQPHEQVVYRFEIPVVIDGRETGRATAEFTEEELQRTKTTRRRASGRVAYSE